MCLGRPQLVFQSKEKELGFCSTPHYSVGSVCWSWCRCFPAELPQLPLFLLLCCCWNNTEPSRTSFWSHVLVCVLFSPSLPPPDVQHRSREQAPELRTGIQTVNVTDCMDSFTVSSLKHAAQETWKHDCGLLRLFSVCTGLLIVYIKKGQGVENRNTMKAFSRTSHGQTSSQFSSFYHTPATLVLSHAVKVMWQCTQKYRYSNHHDYCHL